MKILLDEFVPRILKLRLPQLNISTVQEMGWAGVRNGELLRRAEERFDVFVTADQNLRYQQNLSGHKLAILVLPSNQVPLVVRLVPAVEKSLMTIQPGPNYEKMVGFSSRRKAATFGKKERHNMRYAIVMVSPFLPLVTKLNTSTFLPEDHHATTLLPLMDPRR